MSTRLDVLNAVKALVAAALPQAEIIGFDGEEEVAARVPNGGRVFVLAGDPGDPEIDLSPLTYNWQHRIPIEVVLDGGDNLSAEQAVDIAVAAIGDALMEDRQLGGLCEWLDAASPATEDVFTEGAVPPRGGTFTITAYYSTSSPTG